MPDSWLLFELFVSFARLSLVSIGGIQAVISEVYREVVQVRGWMTASQMADLVALAQAAPGPNGLVVALIGWRVAGVPGFLVSVVAVAFPPAVLAFTFSRVRRRLATARWLRAAQSGLVPVVIGLMLAGGLVSARAADDTWVKVGLTVAVALFVWRTPWNPLWWLAIGAIIGATQL
ncbi:MAG: chromate transporter [Chloroflexota bacterium]